MPRKTPQEKKRLSYAKDRRPNYGNSDKAARTTVPARKRQVNRANRHRARQDLLAAMGRPDAAAAYAAEGHLASRRPKTWKKFPDLPLGIWVEGILERRAEREEGDVADRARLDRAQRRLRRPQRSPADHTIPFPY
ncbi:hypothetical protein [Actinomadura sp. HBU206391]|uniref:hypothetical protein n=1 Tax=Actinomadura sp. HBU206391 TaxID=2731692 RepID=UPI0016508321|nr:hypothetical protein [Actinomadura sp. HBU206391]MBC6456585.1 hypothetical protein [Actinomadura sp. HBU206391]